MKLNGYRASHRNKWFLITKKILTTQEFILFEYYLDLMDFDKSHGDAFSTFEAYLDDVAVVFDRGEDAVGKWHKGLINKGFIKVFDDKRHLYKIMSPLRYVIGLTQWGGEASGYAKEEKNQNDEFILQNIRFFQQKEEKNQLNNEENADTSINIDEDSLVSSKGESMVPRSADCKKIVVIKEEVRSDAEYKKLYEDGDSLDMSPEDIKLADEIVKERIEILNDEQEKEIVQERFNGNWEEYRKSLIN